MKTTITLAAFLIGIFSSITLPAEKQLHRFFELQGVVYKTGFDAKSTEKFLDNALLIVRNEETGQADTVYSGDNGEYYFRLPLDNLYMIAVSKDSFVTKKIHVDTHVPLFAKGKHSMEFELSLYTRIDGMDYSLLDEPIAQVKFNAKRKSFDYDHIYTDQVNRDLKKMYYMYYTRNTIVKIAAKKNAVVAPKSKKRKATVIRINW